jgi:hypothetical protein
MHKSQDNLLVANRVGQLMDRHDIPKQKQTRALADVLLLSFAQAHRKMKGQSNWTFAEIKGVAEAFGEPISVLVDPREEGGRIATNAVLDVGSKLLPCLAWIGEEIRMGKSPEYVAFHVAGVWRIYSPEDAPAGQKFTVELIEIRPKQPDSDKPTIAVVDDDGGNETGELKTADTVCMYLNERGFNATAYYDAATFRDAIRRTVFDAFVVDWLLGTETAEAAIQDIRQSDNPRSPIFILTGQLEAGNVNESDIARVITLFDVNVLEKPARLPLLAAELNKKLTAQ